MTAIEYFVWYCPNCKVTMMIQVGEYQSMAQISHQELQASKGLAGCPFTEDICGRMSWLPDTIWLDDNEKGIPVDRKVDRFEVLLE